MGRKICLLFYTILIFQLSYTIPADEINFPPELLWWIYEVKGANENIEVNKFVLLDQKIQKRENSGQGSLLKYPVFMRWNYYGNYVAYFNYHSVHLERQSSGKYLVYGGDDAGILLIADRNRNVFFADYFGISYGLDAINWLTDTVLIGVGHVINERFVDLVIKEYIIDGSNVKISEYVYRNAFTNEQRSRLNLHWYRQRRDYFELDY